MPGRCRSRPADFFRRIVKRRDMVTGDGIPALGRPQPSAERTVRLSAKLPRIPRGPGGVTLGIGPPPGRRWPRSCEARSENHDLRVKNTPQWRQFNCRPEGAAQLLARRHGVGHCCVFIRGSLSRPSGSARKTTGGPVPPCCCQIHCRCHGGCGTGSAGGAAGSRRGPRKHSRTAITTR